MSTIPQNINNSVFEETRVVISLWLLEAKQLYIADHVYGNGLRGYCVYYRQEKVIAALDHIRAVHTDDILWFTHPSYAACVKFALEYEQDGEQS